MKYGQQVLAQRPVSEWLNGPDADKIVKVDVYEPGYPAMYLTNGAFLSGSGLSLNGTASNLATSPDSSAISITGDIDIQMKLTCNDWQTSLQGFIGKWGTAGNRSYTIYTQNGFFRTVLSNDGTAEITADSANYSITNGATKWIRFTMDVNDGLGNRVFKYYTSDDGSSWTQLGTTQTVAGTTSIFDSASALSIGTSGRAGIFPLGSQSALATFHRLIIRNGYDGAGSVVFDANFESQQYGASSFVESSPNAATVSIQSTAVWQSQWSVPAGATFVKVCCVGGGGGGGSGRKTSLGTAGGGGSGGGSGGVSFIELAASAFTSSVTVTVGAGGIGGAARTTVQNGANGTNGNATTFGTFCGAGGANAGGGGATGGTSGGLGGAGLYGVQGGNGYSSNASSRSTIIVASGGQTGGINSSGVADNTMNVSGSTGLIVGSDVPAVRNFASGSGGLSLTSGTAAGDGGNGQNGCGGGGGGAGLDPTNSGKGGDGGAGLCVVVSYRDVDVQEFTASGTWNKPVGDYSLAKIFVVGGGGGGGSGRRGAAGTDRGGGEAGGGGSITCITVPFSQLGNTETVTVGLGGTGGSGVTTDDTNGTSGNTGGQSSLGTIAVANGGGLGLGAGQSGWSSIKTVAGFSFPGGANGQGSFTAGTAGAGANSYTGGGGAGGAINASNTNRAGGAGGVGAAYTSAVSAAAAGSSASSIATAAGFYGGNGGGGGAAPANSGGNGASKGGGGGGGGASANGTNSGAGGNGGDGYVCVVCV